MRHALRPGDVEQVLARLGHAQCAGRERADAVTEHAALAGLTKIDTRSTLCDNAEKKHKRFVLTMTGDVSRDMANRRWGWA